MSESFETLQRGVKTTDALTQQLVCCVKTFWVFATMQQIDDLSCEGYKHRKGHQFAAMEQNKNVVFLADIFEKKSCVFSLMNLS